MEDSSHGVYRVTFYKVLTNSYGMPFTVCQRSIEIVAARDADQAVEAAKPIFAQHECVPEWFLHADLVEAEALPVPVARVSGLRRQRRDAAIVDHPIAGVRKPRRRRRAGIARGAAPPTPKR